MKKTNGFQFFFFSLYLIFFSSSLVLCLYLERNLEILFKTQKMSDNHKEGETSSFKKKKKSLYLNVKQLKSVLLEST
jgi:hypothetical protein